MKFPQIPPPFAQVWGPQSSARFLELFVHAQLPPDSDRRYLHWDELRRRPAPEGLTHAEWWTVVRLRRQGQLKPLPLVDVRGRPHWFGMPDPVLERLPRIDRQASGRIAAEGHAPLEADRDRYIWSSLTEEAISSSLIEGAATTRRVAKDMLRAGRRPRTPGERMILGNYQGLQYVREQRDEPITPARVLELHHFLTADTLEDADAAGRLRRPDEPITVQDPRGELLHTPPAADELPQRLEALCAFAAGETPDFFVHPVVRAILLHYALAYDHPFVDGNGRTARALFYWSLLREGYWLMEFVPISRVIHAAPAQYGLSFLHTQTDGNDTTYFVLQQLEFLDRALTDLERYLARKVAESRAVERRLDDSHGFNPRQIALLAHALREADAEYTIESHRRSHGVVYETARQDLLSLAHAGLLTQGKRGRALVFRPAPDLRSALERTGPAS